MKPLIIVCGVAVLCMLADRFGLLKPARALMERMVIPFVASAGQVRAITSTPQRLLKDRQKLLNKIAELEQKQAELIAVQQQDQTDQSEFMAWKENHQLSAKFISTSLVLANNAVLPIGSMQGVQSGAMVVAHGAMIGIVTEVQPQFAFVELLESTQNKLSVRVRELNAIGLLEKDGSTVILSHINSLSSLEKGQVVTTTGDGEGILPFIPLGKILRVVSSPSEPFQRAELDLLIHPTNGMAVSVLQTNSSPSVQSLQSRQSVQSLQSIERAR